MIGVVYLGNNPKTEERLKYIPGQLVTTAKTYKEAAKACVPRQITHKEYFIVFFEQNVLNEDITAITYLQTNCKNIYIILLTNELSEQDRRKYQ